MSELIDRQAAIEALMTCQTYLFDIRDPDKKICLESAVCELEQLPSEPPQKVCVSEIQVKIDDIKDYIDKAIEEIKTGEWLHDLLQDAIDDGIITETQASRLMDRIAEDNT